MTNKKKKNGHAKGKKSAVGKQQPQEQQKPQPPDAEVKPQKQPLEAPSRTTTAEQQKKKDAALDWKDHGNALYGTADYATAANAYQSGLDCLLSLEEDSSNATNTETASTATATTTDSSHQPPPSKPQQQEQREEDPLALALRSNLAMCYLKLEEFSKAEHECTRILKVEPENAKALYRRALAREGAAMFKQSSSSEGNSNCDENGVIINNKSGENSNHQLEDQVSLIESSMKDLKLCLNLLDNIDPLSDERKRMKKVAETALRRVAQTYQNNTAVTNATTTSSPATAMGNDPSTLLPTGSLPSDPKQNLTTPRQPPPKAQQKKDVTTLLLNRQIAAQKIVPSTLPAPRGEAFFLVDWKWWCHWCRYVDFFYTNELQDQPKDDKQGVNERAAVVLKMLPPGAVLPSIPSKNNNKKKGTTSSRSSIGTNSTDSEDDTDSDEEDGEGEVPVGPPGVIDNSSLLFVVEPFPTKGKLRLPQYTEHWYDTSSLRPNLVRGHHYELLPREVYSALRSWYGEVTPSVCRRTTDRGVVRLYPRTSPPTPPVPPSTLGSNGNDKKEDPKYQKCSACRAPKATSRCKRCLSVRYCNRACQEGHWAFHKLACKALADLHAKEIDISDTMSLMDRSAGRVGLNQLGNTCFMNSALQCLSHATPLTRHFLSNQFKEDLNTGNPLGTGGKLANAYDVVMKDLWMKHSNNPNKAAAGGGAMSPTALKRAIALFAPRFAGCLQHDAQEFLAYLLDGLHEDLNRIRRAPYVEMPDVTNGQNMAIAAAEAWDAHRRRNDSLVMDSFYGQFKSTCVCPKCERVSVSFDTFNHVSLEIPQLHNMSLTIPVFLFRNSSRSGNSSSKQPLRYGISVRRNSLVEDLRRGLSELAGIPARQLIMCDIYDNAIYELLNDKKPVTSVTSDVLAAYEVDPYTNTSIHVVATQNTIASLLGPSKAAAPSDASQPQQRRLFGFPFMTSFGANLSCRQAWDHIWNLVGYMVVEEGSKKGFIDHNCEFRPEDVLRIQLVDNSGKPRAVFGARQGDNKPEDEKEAVVGSPYIPFSSDDPIQDYLGQDCTENFLFLSLEWSNPPPKVSYDEEDGEASESLKESTPVSFINPKRFAAFGDHPSFTEAIRKRRAKNGVKGVSLDQCFETFTKPERLDENNMWYCSRCKEHVRALKTMKLWRLPNILIVHLKRFEFKHAFRRDKLDTFVDFPLEGLDMNAHCADWSSADDSTGTSFVDAAVPADYDLFGVINHYGRMGFGHYTAYARKWDETGISNEWALFDDSSVKSVGDGTGDGGVVTSAAYVLFYRRRTFH